jgi:uncharacterized repeat protein (TIGR01451 family)
VSSASRKTALTRRAATLLALAAVVLAPASAGAQRVMTNSAAGTYRTPAGVDSVASPSVSTIVMLPSLSLEKALIGPATARVGDLLEYRIRYANGSPDVAAIDVTVVDTLPLGLDVVSTQPAAQVSGNAVAWSVGDVAPGSLAELVLTVRVGAGVRDTLRVRNSAVLSARNAAALTATSAEATLIGPTSAALTVALAADVLEVGLGETAPFTVVVTNSGTTALANVRIDGRLPIGGRYAAGSATGADSVRAAGRDLAVYVAGPLAPGATYTVRYQIAITSAEREILEHTAVASAQDAAFASAVVTSAGATAWVRVRRAAPVATRAGFGKVWADLDADGEQDAHEPGVRGVDVWTDDGSVATTDAAGRFSFRNLRPGRHTFRLDPSTLPAEYRVAGSGAAPDFAVRDASGWTTPRVSFRLLQRGPGLVETRRADASAPPPTRGDAAGGVRLQGVATLPTPEGGATLQVVLWAPAAGWPGEAVYAVRAGWEAVPGSSHTRFGALPDPEARRDRTGAPVLYWARVPSGVDSIAVQVRAAGAPRVAPDAADSVRVAPLRAAADRAVERRRSITQGPGVAIFSPADGAVSRSDRVYVGVRGEPGAPTVLFDGDSLVASASLRIDGIYDFVAIPLRSGPHRLRVQMTNSQRQGRWDSVSVHVIGVPARFVAERADVRLVADGQTVDSVRVRVLDAWGVPVINGALVTVGAEGAESADRDADASSVGVQVRTTGAGLVTVRLRPGHQVRRGRLVLTAGEARGELPLEVLPAARPLMVTGVGRAGFGASPDAFGALTARGRLDARTALTLSYDTRRLDAGSDAFARVSDPLDPAQYPILGDASEVRTQTAARSVLSARVERGFDWLAVGDFTTSDFASGLELAAYRRSLPGGAARVSAGPVTVQGFASSTSQTARQQQIRGEGASGPYALEGVIVPGTDVVAVETRAFENAQRILSRQLLARFVDYQIDYERGTLLLKRAVPSTDVYGNPVFIVITTESVGSGPRAALWGVRATAAAAALPRALLLDSVRVGGLWVQDGQGGSERRLAGADVRFVHRAGFEAGAELAESRSVDSSGVAGAVRGSLRLFGDALALKARWMHAGARFQNPTNQVIRGGTSELTVGTQLKLGSTELRLEHEQQRFTAQGITRRRTLGGIVQPVGAGMKVETSITGEGYNSGTVAAAAQAGEMKVTWTPLAKLSLWGEARRQISHGTGTTPPDYAGAGATYRLTPNVSVEARHREVQLPGDAPGYGITSLGVRSRVGTGGEAWSSYQIAGAGGSHNAAVVGLNQQLRLRGGLTVNGLFERRDGVGGASVTDPARALPFLQQEENYTALALGVELLPAGAPYRLTTRGEYRDGELRSVSRFEAAGDVSINRSLALLMRGSVLRTTQTIATQPALSREQSMIAGVAFRPVGSEALNVLAKLEYVSALNPLSGAVLAPRGEEARTIAALEVIWAPSAGSELAGRFATRRTAAALVDATGPVSLRASADYVGGRASVDIVPRLAARVDGRLLMEHASATARWDAAPQFAITLGPFETAAGYRVGDLRDPDFAANGGPGWFLTVGAKVTERSARSAAEVWRGRLGRR